jgi:DNA-binding transcriptional LysR family regulator
MTLTPRAAALWPAVTRSLAELRATITGEPAFDPRSARRVFTLGTVDYGQIMLLPALLALLEREAPAIDLAVVNGPDLATLTAQDGRIDLALIVGEHVPSPYKRQALFSDGFVCMVRRRHPVAKGTLTLAKYLALRHVVVAPSGAPGSLVDTELSKRGKERRVALRVPNFLVAPLVVSESDLINTGPERLANRLAPLHRLELLPPPLPLPRFTLSIAWHTRFDDDPAHAWLRGVVARVAEAL